MYTNEFDISSDEQENMNTKPKAYLVGGGIGSLAAAAFMIRDGSLPGGNISILEAAPILGGSLDGAGDPAAGYSMRGGRMLTTDNYECTWDLYKSIPSLDHPGKSVFDETVEFNERYTANSMARLVDSRRAKVMVGVGRGAQEGVLVKNAESLERLEKVTTLVVDKTGTLTEGKPKLMDILPSSGFDSKEFLRLTASLEQNSEHPLAAAIVQGAKEQSIVLEPVKDFRSVTGGGVVGNVAGRVVMVGKPDFLRNEKVSGLEPLEASAVKLQEEGKTAMFVAIDGKPAGILAVADPIKATTPEAIRQLHDLGLKLVMLTGDNRRTADAVSKQLGIDAVEAEIEPAGKVTHIKKLRAEGKHVAMAGDGINDAPALSEAEVGIAMGTGTDVAMQSAGITLVKGDLRGIAKAIRLSRATMSNIRQNLFFAFLYNALGIPIAAGILYPFFGLLLSPMIAGAAMSLSSVSVIGNALRLRQVKL